MEKFMDISAGPKRYYIKRTHDVHGAELKVPFQEEVVCRDCGKVFTKYCPLRVWTRETPGVEEGNIDMDYCSRFEFKEAK